MCNLVALQCSLSLITSNHFEYNLIDLVADIPPRVNNIVELMEEPVGPQLSHNGGRNVISAALRRFPRRAIEAVRDP